MFKDEKEESDFWEFYNREKAKAREGGYEIHINTHGAVQIIGEVVE